MDKPQIKPICYIINQKVHKTITLGKIREIEMSYFIQFSAKRVLLMFVFKHSVFSPKSSAILITSLAKKYSLVRIANKNSVVFFHDKI